MDRVKNLKEAYRLVEEVRDSLNKESELCPACGVQHYVNRNQQQTRDVMNAVLNRLEKSIDRIQRQAEDF